MKTKRGTRLQVTGTRNWPLECLLGSRTHVLAHSAGPQVRGGGARGLRAKEPSPPRIRPWKGASIRARREARAQAKRKVQEVGLQTQRRRRPVTVSSQHVALSAPRHPRGLPREAHQGRRGAMGSRQVLEASEALVREYLHRAPELADAAAAFEVRCGRCNDAADLWGHRAGRMRARGQCCRARSATGGTRAAVAFAARPLDANSCPPRFLPAPRRAPALRRRAPGREPLPLRCGLAPRGHTCTPPSPRGAKCAFFRRQTPRVCARTPRAARCPARCAADSLLGLPPGGAPSRAWGAEQDERGGQARWARGAAQAQQGAARSRLCARAAGRAARAARAPRRSARRGAARGPPISSGARGRRATPRRATRRADIQSCPAWCQPPRHRPVHA